MNKEIYQKHNKMIKDKLPLICECFVSFYGEEYRERISNRLNNTLFLFYDKSEMKFDYLNDYNIEVINENDIIDLNTIYKDQVLKDKKTFEGFAFVSARLNNLEQVVCACVLPTFDSLSDQVLFHELNHIIQSDIKFINKNGESRLMTRTGLIRDYYDVDLINKTALNRLSERENDDLILYAGLNEVFTEWTNLKILDKAEKAGFKLGEKKNEEAVYSVAFSIIGKFIDSMIDTMKKTFLEGNKKELLTFVSNQQLNKLCLALNTLIYFEDKHADQMCKKLKYHKLNIEELIDRPLEKIPFDLRNYVNMFKDIKNIIDEIEDENDLYR